MPRGFTNQETELIYEKLMIEGKNKLKSIGAKKTTVDELTRAVGISKGSFYKFYPSKEALFFHIIEKGEQELKDLLFKKINNIKGDFKEGFKACIQDIIYSEEMHEFLHIMENDEKSYVLRVIPQEVLEEHIGKDIMFTNELFYKLNALGLEVKVTAEEAQAYIYGLFALFFEHHTIGEKYFKNVVDSFIETIINKIIA